MRIEFIGAAHEVTGSCHYLEFADKHFLVDCGMEQGADIYENQELPVNASEIDYVFVTHAHIDHSGCLPLLYTRGFRGQIYATNATTKLCNIMLKDSAHIQEQEAEWKNRKAMRAGQPEVEPMYTVEDAEKTMGHFVPCPYGETIRVCEGLEIRFRDAGHLLGSSFIEMKITEPVEGGEPVTRTLIFSGDIGNGGKPMLRDPELPEAADYLLIESTYGDRLHEPAPDYAVELAGVLERTFARGGNVVIPAFSVGRTQQLLFFLRRIKAEHLVSINQDFEVYVDSPLSVEATGIFNDQVEECFRKEALELVRSGNNPLRFPGLKTSVTSQDSQAINFIKKPIVIISASGMCEAGRIRHHLKHNLWRPECSVIFVGYQVPGTLGYNLLNGATEVRLFGETIHVEAEILRLPGISGHADRDHLTAWVAAMKEKPKQIFVVHGQDEVTDHFAEHLTTTLGVAAEAPYSGDVYDLEANACLIHGSRRKAVKKKAQKRTSSVFDRLVAACDRLRAVILRNREGANKDLAKFADQINALCDKWDR